VGRAKRPAVEGIDALEHSVHAEFGQRPGAPLGAYPGGRGRVLEELQDCLGECLRVVRRHQKAAPVVVDETRSALDPRRHDGQAVAMASSTTFEDASLNDGRTKI
jgi:hypothetical protein